MSDVILYLGTCVAGYILALPLRTFKDRLTCIGPLQTITCLFLVLAMGIRIGANEEVVNNLGEYGLYSFIFTVLTLSLSTAVVFAVRKMLKMDRYGRMHSEQSTGAAVEADKTASEETVKAGVDKMTVMIVVCVIVGILLGFFVCRNVFTDFEAFNAAAGMVITVGLCILLLFVGMDLGLSGTVIRDIKSVGLRVLLIPVAVAVGTLGGSAIGALILPLPMNECLSIGSGLGWYSLSSGILLDAGYVTAGAIAFMHNVMRELFSIIFIPIVAKRIGYVESIALPGSPAMDVCLPIVERSTNGNIAVYSFVSGFILSMAVPFLVPLFI